MRTLVVGDVHGCRAELQGLLKRAGFRAGTDKLVMVGDLVDRGPDSVGVVRLAMEIGAVAVLGNHEEKHLRYRRHAIRAMVNPKYKNPMYEPHPETHRSFTPAEWEWMAKMPLTCWVRPDIVVVHGGFGKDSTPQNPHLNSCRIRYVSRKDGVSKGSTDGISQPPDTVFWTDAYDGGENGWTSVIYGHQPFKRPNVQRYDGYWTMGLDTGACYGDSLTGYWVEDREFVVSKSMRSYFGRDYSVFPSYPSFPQRNTRTLA